MSKSNPTDNSPNPASRYFEWDGGKGGIRFYDKESKQNTEVPLPFTAVLLDELSTIKGWHDPSESGIYANEVRDTRAHPFVVKAFKGGILAEGLYSAIKDKVHASGGHFVSNLYIAYKDGEELLMGSLQFKGAALGAWMDFAKNNRSSLYDSAIQITGSVEAKKGKVTFFVPTFKLTKVSGETHEEATELDRKLQTYLKGYFGRTKVEQAEHVDTNTAPAEELDEIPF